MIDRAFFLRPVLEVARDLLGMRLCTQHGRTITSGVIADVEAYGGLDDPASHSYRGKTGRNAAMFMQGGTVYVYFIYGNHFCVNLVTGMENDAAAVLIRGIIPTHGISTMQRRRGPIEKQALTNGPGKVCQALKIDLSCNARDILNSHRIWLERGIAIDARQISSTPRIGISRAKERPWRFFIDPALEKTAFRPAAARQTPRAVSKRG